MAEVKKYPLASGDDYHWGGLTIFDNTEPSMWVGDNGDDPDLNIGLRFPNVTIPQGSIIESAHLTLFSDGYFTGTLNISILGNDVDNAAAPTTKAGADGLALTAGIAWNGVPQKPAAQTFDSPDIKSIIQTIVSRAGWASGNAMQIVIKSQNQTAYRRIRAFDFSGMTYAPELHIDYFAGTILDFDTAPIDLAISIEADLFAPGGLNQILPALEGKGMISVRSAFVIQTLPALEILAAGRTGNVATLNRILPAFELKAYGGGTLKAALPALELSGHIVTGVSGFLNQILPALELSARGFAAQAGSLAAFLPCLDFSARGYTSVAGNFSGILPALTLQASGVSGALGSAVLILPALTIEAGGIGHGLGNLDQILPVLEINSYGRTIPAVITYRVLVLNPKSLALSEYAGFDFNSFALFHGKYLGATATGIHVLEGDKDNGKNIDASLSLGQIPISGGKPRDIWVMGRSEGPMIVTMSEDEDPAEEGRIECLLASLSQDRAKVPRGMNPTYFQVGLKNAQGCAFDLDSIQVFGETPRSRKR